MFRLRLLFFGLSLINSCLFCCNVFADENVVAPERDLSYLLEEESRAVVDILSEPSKEKKTGTRKAHPSFALCDKDGDNLLSKSEFRLCYPILAVKFIEIDQNKDGFISKEEIVLFQNAPKQKARAKKTSSIKRKASSNTGKKTR